MNGTGTIRVLGTVMTMVCLGELFTLTFFSSLFPDAHSRAYGYSSPRRGLTAPFPPSRRAPADPHTFDYPASLKQYAEWFRFYYPQQAIDEDNADKAAEHEAGDGSKPRNGIKSKWEKYKKDFAASQVSNSICPTSVTIMCHCFGIILLFVFMTNVLRWLNAFSLYCSCRRCLITTGNLHGLRKNIALRQNSRNCAPG
jgi:hypothetical protein